MGGRWDVEKGCNHREQWLFPSELGRVLREPSAFPLTLTYHLVWPALFRGDIVMLPLLLSTLFCFRSNTTGGEGGGGEKQ